MDVQVLGLARKLGLPAEDPVVLDRGMNLIIHLRPSPVVARVTRVAHLVRPLGSLAGALAAARSIAGLLPPTDLVEPGPHRIEDGRYVTFWAYVDGVSASPAEAGASLRALHDAARSYAGPLRTFDPRPDAMRIAELVDDETAAVLRAAAASLVPPALAAQAIHGDSHLGNVLKGGLWLDVDEVCIGPREWDLACLRHRWTFMGEIEDETRDALAAYGSYDEDAVTALEPLVVLFTAAWGSLAPLVGDAIGPRTRRRLGWLQRVR